ncbi:hypothetical protein L3X38_023159 [Prunus dulcis]|uniref:Uncharacterized protein n=1 Tax=Prunus dulcis TaxID=3755 RepID=A0AAD4VXB1_PRUDU|nr:hypothetical protein L3X38_023159 [Prunus dulcis]
MTHIFQQNVLQNLNSLCLADTVLVIFSTTLGSSDKFVTPWTGSVVAEYCPLWAWLHSHQPARFCFWELTKQLPRVVTHPGIAPASNSLNFGVPTNPKPVSSQKASSKSEWRSGLAQLHLARYCPLWAGPTPPLTDLFLGAHRATSQGGHPSWDCSSLQLA